MFDKLFGAFSKDIGIDLGTANILVYVKGKGIVIREPSVMAINKKTGHVLAIGTTAQNMIGRTPGYIVATRPLVSGVISDFEVTEQMLKFFIDKVHKESFTIIPRPRVVIGIPSGVTEVERRAVEDAAYNAGAREVYLIEEPIAASIGTRLPLNEAAANVLIDIGGGTTEVVVISLGGIVASRSLRIAGDKLTQDIVRYVREKFNVLIGDRSAENIKLSIGSAFPLEEELEDVIKGRDLITGLPREIAISSRDVRKALQRSIRLIISAVKSALEETPPELISDLLDRGVYVSGGGALLRGFDLLLSQELNLPIKIVDDPLTTVVRGCGIMLENLDELKDYLVPSERR